MTAAISIRELKKVYASGHEALKGISLDVAQGDFFALLGPNGAGKSTTIGVLNSLVTKTSGSVTIGGIDIDKDFSKAKTLLGVVPQEFNFSGFVKVQDIITTQAGFYGLSRKVAKARTETLLKSLGLWEKRNEQAMRLSGGMKRRLMIARALVHEPNILILDEPTAGVDIEMRRSMWDFLKEVNEKGTTIILTTHYLEEAENLCRNIAIIDKGQIVKNTSMTALLDELEEETFIFDYQGTLSDQILSLPYNVNVIDNTRFSVSLKKGQALNTLFAELNKEGIEISSMRNKANRLEELFVNLVEKGKQDAH
ncbi:MAG: ABC transporter ATP-binding protein [Cellvibrionales bacterium]|nr:ABC transporter ATP-binding protein [Cellvibrionales bacterium]